MAQIEIYNGLLNDFSFDTHIVGKEWDDQNWWDEIKYSYRNEFNSMFKSIHQAENEFKDISFRIPLYQRIVWDFGIGSPTDMPDPKNNSLMFFGTANSNNGSISIMIWVSKKDLDTHKYLHLARSAADYLCTIGSIRHSKKTSTASLPQIVKFFNTAFAELTEHPDALKDPVVQRYLIPYFAYAGMEVPFEFSGTGTVMVFPLEDLSKHVESNAINKIRADVTVVPMHGIHALAVWFDDPKQALAFRLRYVISPNLPCLNYQ